VNSIKKRSRLHCVFGAAVAMLCSLAAIAPAGASAGSIAPPGFTGTFADFANCPAKYMASLPFPPGGCLHSYTTSGFVQIGHSTTPISIPGNTLDLGTQFTEPTGLVVAPLDGVIGGPAQPVPGGLLGVVGNHRLTGVTAKLEWAEELTPNTVFGKTEGCGGTDPFVTFDFCRFLNGREGTAITLSVKVHLFNPFLGPNCFIGSAEHPIVMALTTGVTSPPPPAKPIRGRTIEFLIALAEFSQGLNVTLVNNTFSVPAAHGCGTSGGDLIDSAINQKLGLPSPPGRNTIVINTNGVLTAASTVIGHGWTGEYSAPGSEVPGPPAPSPTPAGAPQAGLPDGRGYELVSPVAKNGVGLYGAVPSTDGEAVNYQARGAFGDSQTGSLNLYQANRTPNGWQSASLTPKPSNQLAFLEMQPSLWTSGDLSQTIFTTPASYAPSDQDEGALDLYGRDSSGNLTWLSRGTQGGAEPKPATFDAATPDGANVIFSSGAPLLPGATPLNPETAPEAEYLYRRDVADDQTSLVNLDEDGHLIGSAATTLPNGYTPGFGIMAVSRVEGFFPGQFITVGTGESAVETQIQHIPYSTGPNEGFVVGNGSGLSTAFPPGTPVTHLSEGAVLGDGADLTSGLPPALEYLPANASSGSTTNAISEDGSKVFFESPAPSRSLPVGLYMRENNNSTTTKIAGARRYGTKLSGVFTSEESLFGSARFEGASADGSLAFFSSEEGLDGATPLGEELYEFNTTNHAIGPAAPMSIKAISTGLGGDYGPSTVTVNENGYGQATITVASTAGFSAGETVLFAPFLTLGGRNNGALTLVIESVDSATELTFTRPVYQVGNAIPAGTELHGVHEASPTAISSDGSRVYFISDGVLANNPNSQGATAIKSKPNLYRFDTATGTTTFIGTLAKRDVKEAADSPDALADQLDIDRPAIPTPDGSVLAFASAANLTGQNPWEEFTEIYRYSVAGETMECLSCTAAGIPPVGDADFGETAGGTYAPPGQSSPITEDGSTVFFDTPDSLVSSDRNGASPLSAKFGQPTSTDVYEWKGGEVFMLSAGTASAPSVLQGTNPSGNDALFTSTSQLVGFQADGGYENVFDARVGGGFPAAEEEAAAPPSCVGSGCRGAFGEEPTFTAPASLGSQGDGNLTPTKKQQHKKKKHHKKRHAKKRRAAHKHGGAR
jgi:hypothetical protein